MTGTHFLYDLAADRRNVRIRLLNGDELAGAVTSYTAYSDTHYATVELAGHDALTGKEVIIVPWSSIATIHVSDATR